MTEPHSHKSQENNIMLSNAELTENEKKDLYEKLGRLKNRINSERWKHNLAHQHLSTLHFWLFTLPLAIISMASGILAFMSTIGYSQTVQNNLSIVVGCLSVFAVFLQTIARVCHYESKADMHFSASVDMRDLVDDIESIELERGTKYEIVEKVNIFKTIFGKYSQTMKGCKAIMIPNRIAQAFGIIDAKMVLYKDGCPNDPSSHYIWTLCHNQLYIEISNYTYWPFVIPPAEYVVKYVLNKIDKKKRDDEIEKLWGPEKSTDLEATSVKGSNLGDGDGDGDTVTSPGGDGDDGTLSRWCLC